MLTKTFTLAISIVVSALLPIYPLLALGWDDVTHAVSIYGPLVGIWFVVIGVANRKANQMAQEEQRKRNAALQREADEKLEKQRIEAENLASAIRRDLEATIHSIERRNRVLVGANRELRTLIGRSMEHNDALARWTGILEAKAGRDFVDDRRPAFPHPVSALDLAAVFDEQAPDKDDES